MLLILFHWKWQINEDLMHENMKQESILKQLQSVTKIIGKTAIWTISWFHPLPFPNNVEQK